MRLKVPRAPASAVRGRAPVRFFYIKKIELKI